MAIRTALARHKVPLPPWAEAPDPESAITHADVLGYPVVLKTRAGNIAGQARTRSEVPAVCARVNHQPISDIPYPRPEGILVEANVDGPQIAAEAVVLGDGDVHIAAITRTTLRPSPAQQPIRHCVHAHDNLLHNRLLRQTVTRAVQALGITLGVLHVEMSLTCRGPRVTDLSAHLPGDLIPLLVKRATGINLPQVAADLATGRPPKLTPTRQRAAAVHFAYPAVSGRIEHLAITAPAADQPLVDHFALTQPVGHEVVAAAHARVEDRLAHWVVLGATRSRLPPRAGPDDTGAFGRHCIRRRRPCRVIRSPSATVAALITWLQARGVLEDDGYILSRRGGLRVRKTS